MTIYSKGCSKACSKRGRGQAPGPPVFALLFALAWLANGETASAAACVWTGSGTNNNWSSAGNWTSCGGVAPQNGDSLSFPNAAARAINFNDLTGLSVASINVAGMGAGGQAWSITGNALTLNGSMGIGAPPDASGNGLLFRVPIALATNLTVLNASLAPTTAPAVFGDFALNARKLTLTAAAGPMTIAGVISGDGAVIKDGPESVTLIANTYTGYTSVAAGTLNITTSTALGAASEVAAAGAIPAGLAEGRAGGSHPFHTFILLANPQTTDAEVTVNDLLDSGAGAPVVRTYHVPASTRVTIDVNGVTELKDASFGADITVTNNVPIIVERSLYWDADGVVWSGGTNATGIRLP
jgi:autotransporter-associated beta strand protein